MKTPPVNTPPVNNESIKTRCASQTPAGSTSRAAGWTSAGVFSHIPAALSALPHWVLWTATDRNGKPTKLPKQVNGSAAKSNDPTTWTEFDSAADAYDPAIHAGVGFVFSKDDSFIGIDLDGCRDPETGKVEFWSQKIVDEVASYTEISPSGTGLKIFAESSTQLAKGRKKELPVERVCGKNPGIEIYSTGRFFAVTGNVFDGHGEVRDATSAVDKLLATHWPNERPADPPLWRSDDAVVERARKYVLQIPGAVAGSGGHNTTFTVANRLVNGFGLRKDQALSVLKEWNQTCQPVWSDFELQHKIDDAEKQPGERGYLRDASPERWDDLTNRVDVSELLQTDCANASKSDDALTFEELEELAANEEIEETEATSLPIPLPKEVFENAPGFIGLFFNYLMDTAQKQLPEAFIAAAIAVMSAATGQTYRFPYGQWDTRSNLYLVCLAGSGAGKDYARTVISKLIRQIDTGIMRGMLGPSKFASDAGMLSSLDIQSRQIWLMDEFSKFLGSLSSNKSGSHITNIAELLLELFSESANPAYNAKAYAEAKKSITLNQPHAVIYGTTTPDDCWQSLTLDQVKDGLAGRLLFFEDQYSAPRNDTTVQPDVDEDGCVIVDNSSLREELPAEIVAIPAACYDQAEVVNVRILHDAWARLDEHHRRIDRLRLTEDPMRAALWSRAGEKTSKLSMIAALARGEAVITIDDVNWAILLTNALTRRMVRRVGSSVSENQQDSNVKKMLSIIEKAGGISRRDLTRRTQMFTSRDRSSILNDLLVSEQVVAAKLRLKTKPGEWFGASYRSILEAAKTKF